MNRNQLRLLPLCMALLGVLASVAERAEICGFLWRPVSPAPSSTAIFGVAGNSETLVALGGGYGQVLTSQDGKAWEPQFTGTASDFQEVAWGPQGFLILAKSGGHPYLLTSRDGCHWSARWLLDTGNWYPYFDHIAHVGNYYYGFGGQFDQLAVSLDGLGWTEASFPSDVDLLDLAYGNGTYLGIDRYRIAVTSSEGLRWSKLPSPLPSDFAHIAYGNGRFVASSQSGSPFLYWSEDGRAWHPAQGDTSGAHGATLIFGGGVFVAYGQEGDFFTSADGDIWEPVSVPRCEPLSATYAGGQFIAVGRSWPGGNGLVLTSPDGYRWEDRSTPPMGAFIEIAYGDSQGYFLAMGRPILGDGSVVATSWDGVNWEPHPCDTTDFGRLAYGAGLFATIRWGAIGTSPDGFHWTEHSVPGIYALNDIAFGAGRFVVVGDDGVIVSSSDGETWERMDGGNGDYLRRVVFGRGKFVVLGADGRIFTSPDGIHWTMRSLPVSFNPDKIAAGPAGFIIPRDWQYYFSADGESWQEVHVDGAIEQVQNWGDRFAMVIHQGGFGDPYVGQSEDGLNWKYSPGYIGEFPIACAGSGSLTAAVSWYSALLRKDDCLPLLAAGGPYSGSCSGGDAVTLRGTGLQDTQQVFFGDGPAASFTIDSDEQITAYSPPHPPGAVPISIVARGSAVRAYPELEFEYIPTGPAPTIILAQGGGKPFKITLTGRNFQKNCTVRVGGVAVPLTVYKSKTKVIAKGGEALSSMIPKGRGALVTVTNEPDHATSDPFLLIRK